MAYLHNTRTVASGGAAHVGSGEPTKQYATRTIAAFVLLTFVWSWGLWWISSAIKIEAPGISAALFLAGAFGPGVAALATTLVFEGTTGLRKWLKACLRWRVGGRWYALAVVVPVIIMLVAVAIHAALGGTIPAFATSNLLMAIAQFLLIAIFGGPLGEEFGWRGFALPALGARLGWRWAGVIIGVAWAVWHMPLLLTAGTAQADLPVALFVTSTIGLSVVMARLSVHARYSVLPAILLHSVINWSSMILPIMPSGGDTRTYSLVAGMTILVALLALAKTGPAPSQSC